MKYKYEEDIKMLAKEVSRKGSLLYCKLAIMDEIWSNLGRHGVGSIEVRGRCIMV